MKKERYPLGALKTPKDFRDYKPKIVSNKRYPQDFQLSTSTIKNQGWVGSCVAHSLSSFLEHEYNENFSTGFIYGYRPATYFMGSGMMPRDAMNTLLKIGDCKNVDYNVNEEMPRAADNVNAKLEDLLPKCEPFKVHSYSRIYTEKQIKDVLLEGTTVPVSIPVYNNLEYNKDYVITDIAGIPEGYHMILIYGWNEKGWLFQNSWGKTWGKNGTAILPFAHNIDSAWAIDTSANNIYTHKPIFGRLLQIIINLIQNLFIKKK
jgi:hypothetical protein